MRLRALSWEFASSSNQPNKCLSICFTRFLLFSIGCICIFIPIFLFLKNRNCHFSCEKKISSKNKLYYFKIKIVNLVLKNLSLPYCVVKQYRFFLLKNLWWWSLCTTESRNVCFSLFYRRPSSKVSLIFNPHLANKPHWFALGRVFFSPFFVIIRRTLCCFPWFYCFLCDSEWETVWMNLQRRRKKQVEKKKQRFSRILQSAFLPICAARER